MTTSFRRHFERHSFISNVKRRFERTWIPQNMVHSFSEKIIPYLVWKRKWLSCFWNGYNLWCYIINPPLKIKATLVIYINNTYSTKYISRFYITLKTVRFSSSYLNICRTNIICNYYNYSIFLYKADLVFRLNYGTSIYL